MKKLTALLLTGALVLSCAACGASGGDDSAVDTNTEAESTETAGGQTDNDSVETETTEGGESETETTEAAETTENAESTEVMTYAEYAAADLDTEVVVETYVQAKQSWWDDKATVYTQDEDGAYFLYNMACSEDDYELLTQGTKIRVTGYKSEWEGEVEIIDATFEIIDGNYVAEAKDVTDLLGTDELIDSQNQFVSFTGMIVEAANDNGDAFMYNYDGSGEDGSDLYFNVSYNGTTYTFTVESYLCGPGTDVYEAVKALNVGDTVDMEGFLYWYEGVNPHITSVTVK
jgi:hypothetical protein